MIQNMNQTLNQPFGDGAHILYVKGVNEMYRTMDEVEKECYEEGREKGRETQAELTAINLRKLGLPLEQIAHAVGFHVEKVEKWVK